MRALGFLALLTLTLPVWAVTNITTQIHDLDYGKRQGEDILVLLKSGLVAKISPQNKSLLAQVTAKGARKEWFRFTLDEKRFIIDLDPAAVPEIDVTAPGPLSIFNKSNYVPTTVASMEVAQKYHREGRRNSKDSQCFNRAMVWAYDWWKNHSLKSMKILIFFTRNYIRRYDFEWWFHIAPYIHVMENGKVVERAMDLKYTRRPLPFRKWTDIFMKNKAECPVITKYSEYADFPYTGECMIIRTSMYTYQPADIQMNEAWGYTKTSFIKDEVRAAYLEAYDIHFSLNGE